MPKISKGELHKKVERDKNNRPGNFPLVTFSQLLIGSEQALTLLVPLTHIRLEYPRRATLDVSIEQGSQFEYMNYIFSSRHSICLKPLIFKVFELQTFALDHASVLSMID